MDGFTKSTRVATMLANILADKVSNIVVDMYPDVDCKVSNFVVNMSADKKSQVWTHHYEASERQQEEKGEEAGLHAAIGAKDH